PVPAPPKRPPGSFQRCLELMLHWEEVWYSHARRGPSTARPALKPVLKKICRGYARGLPEWEIGRLSRQADVIGRHSRLEILPPHASLPDIDAIVAKEFGLSVRTVRRYRSHPRLGPFRSVPPWRVREWERAAANHTWAMAQARRLLTPERLAKGIQIGEWRM